MVRCSGAISTSEGTWLRHGRRGTTQAASAVSAPSWQLAPTSSTLSPAFLPTLGQSLWSCGRATSLVSRAVFSAAAQGGLVQLLPQEALKAAPAQTQPVQSGPSCAGELQPSPPSFGLGFGFGFSAPLAGVAPARARRRRGASRSPFRTCRAAGRPGRAARVLSHAGRARRQSVAFLVVHRRPPPEVHAARPSARRPAGSPGAQWRRPGRTAARQWRPPRSAAARVSQRAGGCALRRLPGVNNEQLRGRVYTGLRCN